MKSGLDVCDGFPAHIRPDGTVQTVKEHSIGCAIRAKNKLSSIGLGQIAYVSGLLHDFGKATSFFSDSNFP